MWSILRSTVLSSLLFLSASALPATEPLSKRACTHSATSRNCWGNYDIDTDYYTTWPNTGVTREYTFHITNQTMALDGVPRIVLAVNGQYPGPKVEANWGDKIRVHVYNDLQNNGTSIHWHGMRHLNEVHADGAISATQCPIAPGDHYTYEFTATQYGTSWYHSHFSLQYSEGVVGPIVIHGPASANYDIDLGPILLTDWWHTPVFKLQEQVLQSVLGLPPTADNGLINGKNTYNNGGSRFQTKFTAGKKHRLRLVNTGSDVPFRFSIDGHKMTVIEMDWVPIKPYETDNLFIHIGQRYDVIVEADQTPKDYWMRAVPQISCLNINTNTFDIRGIVRYDETSTATPVTIANTILDFCADEPSHKLVPWVVKNVGSSNIAKTFEASLLPLANGQLAFKWFINHDHYAPDTYAVSMKRVLDNPTTPIPDRFVPQDISVANNWVYFVVQSTLPLAHPFHLHGHDFYVLAQGVGKYLDLPILPTLDTTNPVRRDVALLPATGFLVIAFKSDNPGTWLMHCHIAFHLHGGLALQVIERKSEIAGVVGTANRNEMNRVCNNWLAYDPLNGQAMD